MKPEVKMVAPDRHEMTATAESVAPAEQLITRLRGAAELLMRYRYNVWRYGDSIGFEGLLAATDVLDEPRYGAFAHGVIKGWIPRMQPFEEFDNTAPGHALCSIFERTGDDALVEAAVRLADFLASRPRLGDVFITHSEMPLRPPFGSTGLGAEDAALLAAPGPGVVVDCLHFDAPFFAHLGSLLRSADLVDEAVRQTIGFIDLLQDGRGLFWHFALERTDQRYGYGWGRGQGWALLGLLDVLRYLPASHAGRGRIEESLRSLCRALAETQLPSGAWGALANEPSSRPESSTAAFVATGFARGIGAGLLDDSYRPRAQAAWESTIAHLGADGLLGAVSAAVYPATVDAHYGLVPTGYLVPWGQGPLLTAAVHMLGP
jgi:unsaturated rhamnogalacturonyl hydrolase